MTGNGLRQGEDEREEVASVDVAVTVDIELVLFAVLSEKGNDKCVKSG